MNIRQFCSEYLRDEKFRSKVKASPEKFASKLDTENDAEAKIVFNESDTINLVIPTVDSMLSDQEMDSITGGVGAVVQQYFYSDQGISLGNDGVPIFLPASAYDILSNQT